MTDIDWEGKQLVIPPERMKSDRAHILHLNKTAMNHLVEICTDRELVFQLPVGPRQFYKWFHNFQTLAGIPKAEHHGLQNFRQTLATRLCENSLQAAQLALGHAGSDVTIIKHYVQSTGIVSRALDALPQPSAFVGEGDKPAA